MNLHNSPVPDVDEVPVEEHVGFLDELCGLALGEKQVATLVEERGVEDLGGGI